MKINWCNQLTSDIIDSEWTSLPTTTIINITSEYLFSTSKLLQSTYVHTPSQFTCYSPVKGFTLALVRQQQTPNNTDKYSNSTLYFLQSKDETTLQEHVQL